MAETTTTRGSNQMTKREYATRKFETTTFGQQTHELWLPLHYTEAEVSSFCAELRLSLLLSLLQRATIAPAYEQAELAQMAVASGEMATTMKAIAKRLHEIWPTSDCPEQLLQASKVLGWLERRAQGVHPPTPPPPASIAPLILRTLGRLYDDITKSMQHVAELIGRPVYSQWPDWVEPEVRKEIDGIVELLRRAESIVTR